jgi:hypothetical protein
MNRIFIRKHITSISIAIFVLIFIIIQYIKPSFLYNKDGSIRQFGLGYRRKTILPVWLVAIVLAILSYLLVLYYLTVPKMKY